MKIAILERRAPIICQLLAFTTIMTSSFLAAALLFITSPLADSLNAFVRQIF